MRIPAGKLLKGLACLSMLWFALSLWFTAVGRHQQLHHSHSGGGGGEDTLDSDLGQLLLPRDPQRNQEHQRQQRLLGRGGNRSGGGSGSGWSFGDPLHEEQQLREWLASERHYCSHHLLAVPAGFARLRGGVAIDPGRGSGRKGGEEISEVLNQSENSEYWTLRPGAFRVVCPEKPPGTQLSSFVAAFHSAKSHLNTHYLPAATTLSEAELAQLGASPSTASHLAGPVLAVTRYEYANLYHSMTDFYSAFLACIYYGVEPANATVLLLDGHPRGSLDPIWSALFGRVLRIGQLGGKVQLTDDLIWVMMSYDAPLHHHNRPHLPLHEQFRRFFLTRHGVPVLDEDAAVEGSGGAGGGRNCTGLRMLFVWRRDYVAHPRNPKGQVVRKVANEGELEAEARSAFPELKLQVSSAALENMAFEQQLRLASQVQILAGMHGAALTHTLFLPRRSGLMELYPNYWSPGNIHFRAMARWRGLAYERWVNGDPGNELPGYRTHVPKGTVTRLLGSLLRQLGCSMK